MNYFAFHSRRKSESGPNHSFFTKWKKTEKKKKTPNKTKLYLRYMWASLEKITKWKSPGILIPQERAGGQENLSIPFITACLVLLWL